MSMLDSIWAIELNYKVVVKGENNVFANSLIGTTIQDSGKRERSNAVSNLLFLFILKINNLLHGACRQTVVATFVTTYKGPKLHEKERKKKEKKRKERKIMKWKKKEKEKT